MSNIIIDIETVPQPMEVLLSRMPEDIRNPRMPEELANPVEPNFSEKVPAYGLPELLKKREAITEASDKSAKLFSQIEEAKAKQTKWIEEQRSKWESGITKDREGWQSKTDAAKEGFTRKAALDARMANCKIIGFMTDSYTRIFLWEPDQAQFAKVRSWWSKLDKIPDAEKIEHQGPRPTRMFRDRPFLLSPYQEEATMLKAFFDAFQEEMSPLTPVKHDPNCITYYGNTFDFPFLYRRSWLLGVPQVPLFRRGRYWSDRMIDLHEYWQMGSREEKSGGLEGLAMALGAEAVKANDSGTFSEWYAKDPVEGIAHCINDLSATKFCATKMGIK